MMMDSARIVAFEGGGFGVGICLIGASLRVVFCRDSAQVGRWAVTFFCTAWSCCFTGQPFWYGTARVLSPL